MLSFVLGVAFMGSGFAYRAIKTVLGVAKRNDSVGVFLWFAQFYGSVWECYMVSRFFPICEKDAWPSGELTRLQPVQSSRNPFVGDNTPQMAPCHGDSPLFKAIEIGLSATLSFVLGVDFIGSGFA
ncbi:hypothetical protein CEXT_66511 [Caerostris extrusa]|uniref:Uncharacterized protein n=1 Tax=Caerostris extrusa TaxID=172846 RepID=A0AAV4XRE1_CAEEX|nr:hypothetical protein CEXT_66511 [Caerostris extrusa]